jgi:hypothetical protein
MRIQSEYLSFNIRWMISSSYDFQVHPKFSPAHWGVPNPITITPMVLQYQSSEISVTPKAGRNALLQSVTLLKLTYLRLHSTSSQTLREASRDENIFRWFTIAFWWQISCRVWEQWFVRLGWGQRQRPNLLEADSTLLVGICKQDIVA